jgi:sodium transport system ATP-binding protein
MQRAKELGRAVIFSTHQMYDAEKLCDRVFIIHKGKMVAYDTVDRIKQSAGAGDLEDAFLKLVGKNS